ncbi:MAG: VOC family protein [Vicinamibacterales bacterium]|nr:VOC family protein [Vicinamibacterales bacterium]
MRRTVIWTKLTVGLGVIVVTLGGCGGSPAPAPEAEMEEASVEPTNPFREFGITANNAFFYYDDVERAAEFYTDTLGIDQVADYDFAKILRPAGTSYLILVDAEMGMHSTDEPKSVALALLTDELEAWHEYLQGQDVEFRSSLSVDPDGPHDGFVVLDPEGYLLEFERFNDHPENVELTPQLARLESLYPPADQGATAPSDLGIKATVLWLYYADMIAIQAFWEEKFGLDLTVDQGWAKLYQTSPAGYIGLVDGERGMRDATETKAVTVSFFTDDIRGWFDYARDEQAFELRSEAVSEADDRFLAFVGYDPEGYFLEFDTFLEHELNTELLEALAQ